MSSVDSGVDTDCKAVITTKMVALNRFSKDKSFEENMDEFYDIFIAEDGSELFACKFDGCPSIEKQESDIIQHLRQHFFEEVPSNTVDINLSDNSGETKKCKPEIESDVEVECINISDEDTSESVDNMTNGTPVTNSAVDWEQWIGIGFNDGKQMFFCRFTDDCAFKTNLRMKMKSHINKHFETPVNPKIELNEYEYWEKCLNSVHNTQTAAMTQTIEPLAESTPRMRSASKSHSKSGSKAKSGPKPKSQTKKPTNSGVRPQNSSFNDDRCETSYASQTPNTSSLIDINFNHNNTILSLKGMASVKKLEKYIQCRVIQGLKYFCCNFGNKCEFKSKRSQETANHVHCAHLGFYLECVRPDCDKIFRTPGSWREHQKNHICNFGLYGYQRGVSGNCRNQYLLQFQEKVIVDVDHKAYKCKWKGCGFVTRQRTACKRHIHNSHVCPFRKNKQWKKELLKFMDLKSHMTDIPIPVDIKNERAFYCSRRQCNAECANEADLKRHESHFCMYRKIVSKSVKNGQNGRNITAKNNQKPRAVARLVISPESMPSTSGVNDSRNRSQNSNKKKNIETVEQIRENGHKVEERRVSNDMQSNGENLKNDMRAKCEVFIERKLYDGINFILCTAPNCKYTTKVEDKIYDHIQKMHSLVSPRVTSRANESTPQLRNDRKRSQSSQDSNDTIISKKSKNSTNGKPVHQSSQTHIQKTPQKVIQNSVQTIPHNSTRNSSEISSKKSQNLSQKLPQNSCNSDLRNKFKNYYKVKRIEEEPFYFCEYPSSECRFYSKTEKELTDHISQTHIVFRCDVSNCKREFKTEGLLEIHRRNHICGFGISGMKATGVCALENVRKYRREILVSGRYFYECKVCKYKSETKSKVLSHAHNRHIHPQPPPQ